MPGCDLDPGFDLDAFLARPLVARVAAAGPTIRPVWFQWEEPAFWWLTGGWSGLPRLLASEPEVAVVVDTCDLRTGEVLQVVARGAAEVVPFDEQRARRKLSRYLGTSPSAPPDFPRLAVGNSESLSHTARRLALRRRTWPGFPNFPPAGST